MVSGPGDLGSLRTSEEAALVRRALRGDGRAFAALVKPYERLAYRTAYLIAGSADADEALQNALIKTHAALRRFDQDRSFRPWFLKIVVNEARTARRHATRHRAIAGRALDDFDARSVARSTDDEFARADRDRALRAAIDRLPERHRTVVTCRYLLDLSEEETAASLGIPSGTIKSRLSRALERLRAELASVEGVAA